MSDVRALAKMGLFNRCVEPCESYHTMLSCMLGHGSVQCYRLRMILYTSTACSVANGVIGFEECVFWPSASYQPSITRYETNGVTKLLRPVLVFLTVAVLGHATTYPLLERRLLNGWNNSDCQCGSCSLARWTWSEWQQHSQQK